MNEVTIGAYGLQQSWSDLVIVKIGITGSSLTI